MQALNAFLNTTASPTNTELVDGLLSGKRLAVKDLFHIANVPTTAGNPDWLKTHPLPKHTNSTVSRLLQFGAQFVGKTVTDELAYSLNGQNIHYGTPTNVNSPDRLPGGSSSGSAVAVAANLAEIGLGTDTGGSIRVPASYNGLYGLRPTHGVIEMDNMVPLAPSFDTIGWMTRTLEELYQVAKILLPDAIPFNTKPVCGVLENVLDTSSHKLKITQWIAGLDLNIEAIYHFSPQSLGLAEAFRVLQGKEIWQQHGEWFQKHNPEMAEDIKTRLLQCELINPEQVASAQQVQNSLIEKLKDLFQFCDFLVIPTTPGVAPLLTTPAKDLVKYRQNLISMTAIAGLAGLPQLHLPLFQVDGAPCGASLIGRRGSDIALVKQALSIS